MKSLISFLLIISTITVSAQNQILLEGTIVGDGVELESIIIVNESTNESTKTDSAGKFQIIASKGDTLTIASIYINGKRIAINSNHVNSKAIQVTVTPNVNILDEVKINSVNALSTGVLDKPAKSFTPAERLLETAGDFKPIHLLGILGGSMPVDPLINKITGRTKRLKNEVQIEKRELLLPKIVNFIKLMNQDNRLEIPLEYERGFAYYLLENTTFVTSFNSNDNIATEFMLTKLAPEYLKTIR